MSKALRIFVIGGHGRVAQSFTKVASESGHDVVSQIRNADHAKDLPTPGPGKVEPLVESLEALDVSQLAQIFQKQAPNVILFSAGAGGKGGPERTFTLDRDGAIKVFDALEKSGIAKNHRSFHRLLLVSAIDVRDVHKTKPDWYSEQDFATSKRMREILGPYMQAKYEADLNLSKRSSFPWTVLRPATLKDDSSNGVALAQRQTISQGIPRIDVAKTLVALAELPPGTTGANGMAWDLVGGQGNIHDEVQKAVQRARSDWVG